MCDTEQIQAQRPLQQRQIRKYPKSYFQSDGRTCLEEIPLQGPVLGAEVSVLRRTERCVSHRKVSLLIDAAMAVLRRPRPRRPWWAMLADTPCRVMFFMYAASRAPWREISLRPCTSIVSLWSALKISTRTSRSSLGILSVTHTQLFLDKYTYTNIET